MKMTSRSSSSSADAPGGGPLVGLALLATRRGAAVRLALAAPPLMAAVLPAAPSTCRWAQAIVQREAAALSPPAAHCAWHLRRTRFISAWPCAPPAGALAGGGARCAARTPLGLELGQGEG